MPNTATRHLDYEVLGIFPDTWTCVAMLSKRNAQTYVWALAQYGVACRLSKDADGKRWHVAVQGGLAASPAAWIATIRPDTDVPVCAAIAKGQHPQAQRA